MAVYTHVTESQIQNFLSDYALQDLQSFHGILQGVENTNYRLEMAGGKRFILTLFEKRTNPEDLPFFFAFSGHLAAHGIACPHVIGNRFGTVIGQLCGRPAAIISYLDGRDIAAVDITPAHCAGLGRVLGKMHRAAQDFSGSRENTLSLSGWKRLAERTALHADRVAVGLGQVIANEIDFLEHLWPAEDSLPCGVIHADLFPDNVFFKESSVSGVIDFYFSCTDFFAYDLAIILNAWCFDMGHNMAEPRWQALLAAYTAERALNDAEKKSFNVLCRGAALRFLMTRLHDWVFQPPEALVTPKDPIEYLKKLQWHQNHDIVC